MKWFAWSTVLIVGVAVIWWMVPKGEFLPEGGAVSLKDFPEPIAAAEWEDGYRFEVLRIGVGSVEDGSMVAPSGSLMSPVKTSTRTYIDGKLMSVEVEYFSVDSVPTGLQCSVKDIPGLILMCRYMDESGRALETDAVLSDGEVIDDVIKAMSSYALEPLRFRGREAMQVTNSTGDPGIPDLLIQVRDTEFGWITGEGLLTLDDGGGHRLLALFPAWPRKTLVDTGRLEFRIVRAGVEQMVELKVPSGSIPNVSSSASKTVAELVDFPSVIEGEDYTIKLQKWVFEEQDESYPFVGVISEFVDKTPGDLGRLKDEGFVCYSQSSFYWDFAESDDCNRVATQSKHFEKWGYEQAFSLPLREGDLVTIEGSLLRRTGYPRRRDECVFLGSGGVASDGTTIKVVMDGAADKIGLKRFDMVFDSSVDFVRARKAMTKKVGFQGYQVEFELELDKSAASAYASRLGEFHEWEPVVFFDDDEYSAGVMQLNRGGVNKSITGNHKVTGNYKWEVRAKAGQKIRVGLAKIKENEVIRIRFPVSKQGE